MHHQLSVVTCLESGPGSIDRLLQIKDRKINNKIIYVNKICLSSEKSWYFSKDIKGFSYRGDLYFQYFDRRVLPADNQRSQDV